MADDGSGDLAYDWSAFRDDNGQIFYHNSKTDVTSWEPPPNDERFNPIEKQGQTSDDVAATSAAGDWVKHMDEDKEEPYYYNTVTRETAWERPAGFVDSESSKSPKSPSMEGDKIETTKVKQEADVPVEENAAAIGDWVETHDDEGQTYYYNTKTEETSWDRPAGIKEEKEEGENVNSEKENADGDAIESNGQGMSEDALVKEDEKSTEGDWTETQDDEGRTYYYNAKTEETSWDRPAEFNDMEIDTNPKQEKEEEASDGAEIKADRNWTEAQDDEGRTYYYNTKTEETSWDRPPAFDNKNTVTDAVKEEGKDDIVVEKDEGTSVATEAKKNGNWVEAQDDEGRTYYYNSRTEETMWDRPDDFENEHKGGEAKENEGNDEVVTNNDKGGDWVEEQDDEGRTYYYNTKTEETSWDRPAALENKDSKMSTDDPKSPSLESESESKRDDAVVKKDDVSSADIENEATLNWVETQDVEGRTYYFNAKTEETSWEKPKNFDTQKEGVEMSPVRPQSPPLGEQEEDTSPNTSGNWTEYKDEEGRFYYYNAETQQTVWDKPADFDDAITKSGTGSDSGNDDEADDDMALSPTRPQTPENASPDPILEEEVVDPAVKRLEEAKEALSQSDAIMETGILSDLTEVVKNDGGNPKNAILALSESAHGQTAVCGLLSRWLADLKSQTSSSPTTIDAAVHTKRFRKSADDIREMTQEEINRIVKERFTQKGSDNVLALSKSEAAFLEDMMDSNRWRKLLIDLSASNKDNSLLMYCLQSISKRGHHREIARRINQSEHFPVFNAMLASELAVIGKISVSACHDHDTSISLNELVGDLRRICTSTSYTYLYGFEVLRFQIQKAKSDSLAMAETDRLLYKRVIRKWERLLEVLQGEMIDRSTSTGFTPLFRKRRLDVAVTISDLHQKQRRRFYPDKAGNENGYSVPTETSFARNDIDDDRRKDIESAISTFLRKYCLGTQIDAALLDRMLPKAQSGHEVKFIGSLLVDYPIAIEALLGYLYKQKQRVGSMELRNKCARLTALAVLASETQSLEEARKIDPKISESESDEAALTEMLLKGSQLCEQLENMVSFIVTTDATKINGAATSPGEQICSLAIKCAPVSQGVAMWAREITRGVEFVSTASYGSISPNIMTLVRIVYMYHPFTRDDVCDVAFQFLKQSNSEVAYQTMNNLKEQSLRLLLFLCTRGEAPSVFDQLITLLKDPGRSSLDASLIRYFISGLLEIASPPFSIPFIRSLMNLLKSPASVDAVKATYFDKNSKNRLSAIINYLKTRTSGKLDSRPLAKEDISLINSVVSIYHTVSD